jgi:hypothetical protein
MTTKMMKKMSQRAKDNYPVVTVRLRIDPSEVTRKYIRRRPKNRIQKTTLTIATMMFSTKTTCQKLTLKQSNSGMREEARSYQLAPGGSCSNRSKSRNQNRKRKSKRNLIAMRVKMLRMMMTMIIA